MSKMTPPQDNKCLDELTEQYAIDQTGASCPLSSEYRRCKRYFRAGYRARDEEVSNAKAEGYTEAVRELRSNRAKQHVFSMRAPTSVWADYLETRGKERGVLK